MSHFWGQVHVPTLIEALGLPPPETLDGVSRWRPVIDGTTIPDHDSFAVEAYGALSALFRPPLGYYEAHCRYRACDRCDWFPGDRALRRIDEPLVANPVTAGPLPDPAEAMRNRLVTRFGVR